MESIYSLFYTGTQSPFGIGTWDTKGKKLNNSSSTPYFIGNSRNLKPKLAEKMKKKEKYSQDGEYIKLPKLTSKYDSLFSKNKKRTRKMSSESSSISGYDTKKHRKELSSYISDINNSIAMRLQNDNLIAQKKLNNMKNNYKEIRTLLNNKIEKLEQDQQMQIDSLKHAIEQGGGLKLKSAVKNSMGGNKFDLKKAEKEDMLDITRKLPILLENKINQINEMKMKEKKGEKKFLSKIRKKLNEEIQKQKELDEIRFKKEIYEIEQQRENIRQERKRVMDQLNAELEVESDSEPSVNYSNPHNISACCYPPQMCPQYPHCPYHPFLYPPPPPPVKNDSTSDFLKLFLLQKLMPMNSPNNNYNENSVPFVDPLENMLKSVKNGERSSKPIALKMKEQNSKNGQKKEDSDSVSDSDDSDEDEDKKD